MGDVFGLLGELDPFSSFRYSEEDWGRIKTVVGTKLGRDADEVNFQYLYSHAQLVPLRVALEVELGLFQLKTEFGIQYPLQTTRQILPQLKRTHRLLRDLRQTLRSPEVSLYAFDWGNDRGGPKTAILLVEGMLRQVKSRIEWLARVSVNEPFPGHAAPEGVVPADGWQTHHRDLSADPEAGLVRGVLRIFAGAFERKPGISETGPASQFLHAALRPAIPDLADSRVWYWLRKFSNEF